jgi:hypothetical protein
MCNTRPNLKAEVPRKSLDSLGASEGMLTENTQRVPELPRLCSQ